jgi:hypothetical protein
VQVVEFEHVEQAFGQAAQIPLSKKVSEGQS